ncbi:hypothetical protein O3P69_014028 [Scylla paramamosain]|uniref:Uncharacterized protein n=1 Tax=Scylla paramamosain TaxID=85552 RepID=A0AAW0SS23_SCYPA
MPRGQAYRLPEANSTRSNTVFCPVVPVTFSFPLLSVDLPSLQRVHGATNWTKRNTPPSDQTSDTSPPIPTPAPTPPPPPSRPLSDVTPPHAAPHAPHRDCSDDQQQSSIEGTQLPYTADRRHPTKDDMQSGSRIVRDVSGAVVPSWQAWKCLRLMIIESMGHRGMTYEMAMTSTPPQVLHLHLPLSPSSEAVILRIFPKPQRYDTYVDGVFVPSTNLNTSAASYYLLPEDPLPPPQAFLPTLDNALEFCTLPCLSLSVWGKGTTTLPCLSLLV